MQRALWILVALAAACREPRPAVTFQTRNGKQIRVEVEVVDTPQSRSLGLMYRTDLAPDRGMIFLFEKEEDHAFWMKNTPLSLDMIFLSGDGKIAGIRSDAEPFSLAPINAGVPSRAVLEVRAGFSKRHGLQSGDRVAYRGIRSRLLP